MSETGEEGSGGTLVVQTAFLGDVVLTTPLLRVLKRSAPGRRLTVLVAPVGRAAVEGLPFVDRVIVFDKRGSERSWAATARLAWRLRAERFSLAVAAQRSHRTGFLLRATGAPARVGFAGSPGAWACNRTALWRADGHAVDRYLALASAAGVDPAGADRSPEVAVSDAARRSVAELLAAEGVGDGAALLAVAPGSIWGTKRWTPEGFTAVAREAALRGLRVVFVGAPDERELCDGLAARVPRAIVAAGRTSVAESAALLARCAALVANDSGSGHLAAAVGTPVVTIFGPTVPSFGYAPFGAAHRIVQLDGLDCRPCHKHGPAVCPLSHHRCMREIDPPRVLRALDDLLGGRPAART